jgi:hypothetical protein
MKDLMFFVCFLLIFLLGFSIASWSLINTTNQVFWNYTDDGSSFNVTLENGGTGLWNWEIIRDVTNYGIWKIFGQIDPIRKIIEIKFLIIKFYLAGTDAYSDTAFVLAILFVAVSNVLLLNVLVALFK